MDDNVLRRKLGRYSASSGINSLSLEMQSMGFSNIQDNNVQGCDWKINESRSLDYLVVGDFNRLDKNISRSSVC